MYKLAKNSLGQTVIIRSNGDGSITSFFENSESPEYQAYLAWVAEGNVAQPADTGA